jgi:hypothetical protein
LQAAHLKNFNTQQKNSVSFGPKNSETPGSNFAAKSEEGLELFTKVLQMRVLEFNKSDKQLSYFKNLSDADLDSLVETGQKERNQYCWFVKCLNEYLNLAKKSLAEKRKEKFPEKRDSTAVINAMHSPNLNGLNVSSYSNNPFDKLNLTTRVRSISNGSLGQI